MSGAIRPDHKKVHEFFNAIGVNTYGEREKINLTLNKYYRSNTAKLTFEKHTEHLTQFISYYLTDNNKNDKSLFKNATIIFTDTEEYYLPKSVYLTYSYIDLHLEYYFQSFEEDSTFAISDLYLTSEIELSVLVDFFKWIGCISNIRISPQSTWSNPERMELRRFSGKRTRYEVDTDFTIKNLEDMLDTPSTNLSKLLWDVLNNNYSRYLHAEAKYRPNQSEYYKCADSSLLFYLKSKSWIPTNDGRFLIPQEITGDKINPEFSSATNSDFLEDIELYYNEKKERVLSDEKLSKAKDIGLDPDDLEFSLWVKENLSSEERDKIRNDYKNVNNIELPNYTPRNPEYRAGKVKEDANTAPVKEKEIRERSVSVGKNITIERAKIYLTTQYTIDDSQICQICQSELPFKKLKGGDFYFEAIEYSKKIQKSHSQNYLCLCPNHAAMFKYANEYTGSLKELLNTAEDNRVEIKLAGDIESIYFTDTHLLDLRTIFEIYENEGKYERLLTSLDKVSKNVTLPKNESGILVTDNKQYTTNKFIRILGEKKYRQLFNWSRAHLYVDSNDKWCLSTKTQTIMQFESQHEGELWWKEFSEQRGIIHKRLNLKKPTTKKVKKKRVPIVSENKSYGYTPTKGFCPICNGGGGSGGNCYKCRGSGWV